MNESNGKKGLLAQIEALDPCSLDLLGVLALENRPLSRKQWLERADVRGVSLTSTRLKMLADDLTRQRLVFSHSHGQELAPSSIILPALTVLHARGRLVALSGPERKRQHTAAPGRFGHFWTRSDELATDLRLAAVGLDESVLRSAAVAAAQMIYRADLGRWLRETLGSSPSAGVLRCFPEQARESYLIDCISNATLELGLVPEPMIELALELSSKPLALEVGRLLILRGQAARALELRNLPPRGAEGLAVLAAFWAGDRAEAAKIGAKAIAGIKTAKQKYLPGIEGICHGLAALTTCAGDPHGLEALENQFHFSSKLVFHQEETARSTLAAIRRSLMGARQQPSARLGWPAPWLTNLVCALHDIWLDLPPPLDELAPALEQLRGWSARAQANGYGRVARELDACIAVLGDPRGDHEAAVGSLATALRVTAPWETALTGLEAVVAKATPPTVVATQPEKRLSWVLEVHHGHGELTPRVRSSARARKGTAVPLSRLLSGRESYVDADDQRILSAAEPDLFDAYGRKRRNGPLILGPRSLVAAIGHPRVVDDLGNPRQVMRGQPRLRTRQTRTAIRIELEPRELGDRDAYCEVHEDRVWVYERTPELARVAEILGNGLSVPEVGKERLGRTLARLCVVAGIEIEGDLTLQTEEVVADSRPTLLLGWDGETLSARACAAPLGLDGPHLRPGIGNPTLTAELRERGELRLVRCERELGLERRRLDELERACPTLLSYAENTLEWRVPSLSDALEVMLELGRLGDAVVLAWPHGRVLRPPSELNLDRLKLAVSSQRDWLGVEVELEIDEGEVLSFRRLLDSRAGARFVRLDDDRFVAPRSSFAAGSMRWRVSPIASARACARARPCCRCSTSSPSIFRRRALTARRSPSSSASASSPMRRLAARGALPPSCGGIKPRATPGCGAWPKRGSARAWPMTWGSARPCRPWRCFVSARARDRRWWCARPRW